MATSGPGPVNSETDCRRPDIKTQRQINTDTRVSGVMRPFRMKTCSGKSDFFAVSGSGLCLGAAPEAAEEGAAGGGPGGVEARVVQAHGRALNHK